jgi:predicted DNA-binding protein
MEVKVRVIADVKPEIKQKLKELNVKTGKSMTEIISQLIEKEHKKTIK